MLNEKSGKKQNYIVYYNSLTRKPVTCETIDEVWEAIDEAGWVGYVVESFNGLDVSEFIPF